MRGCGGGDWAVRVPTCMAAAAGAAGPTGGAARPWFWKVRPDGDVIRKRLFQLLKDVLKGDGNSGKTGKKLLGRRVYFTQKSDHGGLARRNSIKAKSPSGDFGAMLGFPDLLFWFDWFGISQESSANERLLLASASPDRATTQPLPLADSPVKRGPNYIVYSRKICFLFISA